MRTYVIRRLFAAVPVLIVVSVFVFSLVRLLPGDALVTLLAESGHIGQKNEAQLRHELGIDRPFVTQYFHWAGGILTADAGESFVTGRGVATQLKNAIPGSLELALLSMLFAVLIAIPVGVISALRQDSVPDYLGRVLSITGLSVPDFIVATLVIVYVGIWFQWAPPTFFTPFQDGPGQNLKGVIVPAAILGFRFSSTSMRMIRSSLLEVLREDYVRTAWAKGLRERSVVTRHVLKNAFIPVITILGAELGYLLGGSVIIESIFNLPGVGQLTLRSILGRDYPQIQLNIMFIATVMIVMNLLVDLSYAWFDPRIHYSTRSV